MVNYSSAYRRYGRRPTPWERYAQVSGKQVAEVLQQETAGRAQPPGRALDLGCGRGTYTAELAHLGWETVGVDAAPEAIDGALRRGDAGIRYVVGDVTCLEEAALGSFDLFVDVGCFQGLGAEQREAMGRSVTTLANAGATLLLFAFGWTRLRSMIEGVTRQEIEEALSDWEMLAAWPAPTAGLGWPMDRTSPQWHRLRLRVS